MGYVTAVTVPALLALVVSEQSRASSYYTVLVLVASQAVLFFVVLPAVRAFHAQINDQPRGTDNSETSDLSVAVNAERRLKPRGGPDRPRKKRAAAARGVPRRRHR